MKFRSILFSTVLSSYGCVTAPEPDTTPPIFSVTFASQLDDTESTLFSSVDDPNFFSAQCWILPEDSESVSVRVVARDSSGIARLNIISGAEIDADNIRSSSEITVFARDLEGFLAFENTTIENPGFVLATTPDGMEINDRTGLTNMNFVVDGERLGADDGTLSRVVDLDVRYLASLMRRTPSSDGRYKLRLVAEDSARNEGSWDTPYIYEPDSAVRAECSNGLLENRPDFDDIPVNDLPDAITSTPPGPALSEDEGQNVTSCRLLEEFNVCRENRSVNQCSFGDPLPAQGVAWTRAAVTTADGTDVVVSPFCDADGTAFVPSCVGGTLSYVTSGTGLSSDDDCGGVTGSICRNGIALQVTGGAVRSSIFTTTESTCRRP